jgi:hypothetical protein
LQTRQYPLSDAFPFELRDCAENVHLQAAAVSSIDVITRKAAAGGGQVEVIHKIRFSPKTPALEILCKHLVLFDEHDPNAGQPDVPAFIISSKVSIT